jgi:hypothetical protein
MIILLASHEIDLPEKVAIPAHCPYISIQLAALRELTVNFDPLRLKPPKREKEEEELT